MAAQAVESDVVGYDTTSLLSGGQAKGAGLSFLNVDKSDLTLGDLSIIGYDATTGYAEAEIQAQQLDGAGRTVGGVTYYWYDFTEEGVTYKGWFDENGESYNDLSLLPGEGLWIYSPNTAFKTQSSGLVPKSPISVTLRSGGQAKLVSNPMPATFKLGQITVSGYDVNSGYAEAEIQAQQLDGAGRTLNGMTYYWYDFTEEGVTYYGWYDENGEDYNEQISIGAGESLWIYSPSTAFSVVFPSPL